MPPLNGASLPFILGFPRQYQKFQALPVMLDFRYCLRNSYKEFFLLLFGCKTIGKINCRLYQTSISPTFYEQLLCLQIPKAQKKRVKLSSVIVFLGSLKVKAARRTLVKLTPGYWLRLETPKKLKLSILNVYQRQGKLNWLNVNLIVNQFSNLFNFIFSIDKWMCYLH